MFINFR